jgi:hypothetical protein
MRPAGSIANAVEDAKRILGEYIGPARGRLLLLRVERSLLGIRLLCQFLDPIEQCPISESGRQTPVMVDLLVNLYALITH